MLNQQQPRTLSKTVRPQGEQLVLNNARSQSQLVSTAASASTSRVMPGVVSGQEKPNMSLAPGRITLLSVETDALINALHL